MKTIYRICTCFDKDVQTLAYVEHRDAAEQLRDEINQPGSMASAHIDTVSLYSNYRDYKDNNPEAIKKRALAKLTYEEKVALGFNPRDMS